MIPAPSGGTDERGLEGEGAGGVTARRLALVQWHGRIGGAEVLTVDLAASMRRLGVSAEVVFVTSAGPLTDRLDDAGIPFRVLGFERGRDILRHPRRYSTGVLAGGVDGVVLPEIGFIGSALRMGGYRGPIVAVEHGILLRRVTSPRRKLVRYVNRFAGAWADDVEVGVSDFTVQKMRVGPHARRICRIHNGLDPARFTVTVPPMLSDPSSGLVAGFAGRLIAGKGADDAIKAVEQARRRVPVRLLIAGDGPDRSRLVELARSLGISHHIEFLGMVKDVRELWRVCDLALLPSLESESFGLAALEAMACGRPVLATRVGAIGEVVLDGVTGTLVAPGDIGALVAALIRYAEQPGKRVEHGEASRARAIGSFQIEHAARAYLHCFDQLAVRTPPRPGAARARWR